MKPLFDGLDPLLQSMIANYIFGVNLIIMASITIRNLDKSVKEKLRVRAANHGHSMEEEVRQILKETVSKEKEQTLDLATSIRNRFKPIGGVELPDIPRAPINRTVTF